MTECQARTDRMGNARCDACGIAWDRDDTAPPCPRVLLADAERDLAEAERALVEVECELAALAPKPEPYVSALAPDRFRR